MEAFVRIFVRMKLKFDPMYREVHDLLSSPRQFIDIGCGYGITSLWILEHFPESKVFAVEPDFERARIAGNVIKERGTITQGTAPNLPKLTKKADAALMIDMTHYLNDKDLQQILMNIHNSLVRHGQLLIRVTIPSVDRFSFLRWIEVTRLKVFKIYYQYRSIDEIKSIVSQSGYRVTSIQKSGIDREEVWFLAKKEDKN